MTLTGTHRDEEFSSLELENSTIRRATFEACTFRACRFESVRFEDCRFVDCTLEQVDWIAVALPATALVDVQFKGGRAMAVDWSDVAKMTLRIGFSGTKLDYGSFFDLPLRRTTFEDCSLVEADFTGADLTSARFADCELSRARFDKAKLIRTDFTGSRGLVLPPKSPTFRDTKVEPDTALLVLRSLGLVSPDLEALIGWADD